MFYRIFWHNYIRYKKWRIQLWIFFHIKHSEFKIRPTSPKIRVLGLQTLRYYFSLFKEDLVVQAKLCCRLLVTISYQHSFGFNVFIWTLWA